MIRLKRMLTVGLLLLGLSCSGLIMTGCGPTRSYWGVESEYHFNDGGHGYHHGHRKPKPPKHKKYKKHKKHHHHDHDWDD